MIGAPTAVRRLAGIVLAVAGLLALAPGAGLAQAEDPLAAIEAENAALEAKSAAVAEEIERAVSQISALSNMAKDLDERMRRIEQRAEVRALGPEFAELLVRQLQRLPRPQSFVADREARARLILATSDDFLQAEDKLRSLASVDTAAAELLAAARPPVAPADQAQVGAALRKALHEQRRLLTVLTKQQGELFNLLREVQKVERAVEGASGEARERLNRLLYWLPALPSTQTMVKVPSALAWSLSAEHWRAAAATLAGEVKRHPFWPTLALLAALALQLLRGRLRRGIAALAPAAAGYGRYWIGYTLAALAFTAALAAPAPLLLRTASLLLADAPGASAFDLALGDALHASARLLFGLAALSWLLDRDGVVARHFGGDAESLAFGAHTVRVSAAVFVPLIFFASLNGLNHAPWGNRESLGRMAFGLAMVANAVLFAHLLRRRSPLMQRLFARSPRSLAVALHGLWAGALVALPLALVALAAGGYFVLAEYLWGKMLTSLFVILGAVALYGLMALWVQGQHVRLARLRREDAMRQAASAEQAEAGGEAAEVSPPRLDLAAIGEQTRSLLDLLVTLLLLGGLWLVWKDALPLLALAGDYSLWTVTETVDGAKMTRHVTPYSLLLALFVAAVIVVIVRNIGALLDIALLQRFEMQADATYAVKVITRYLIAAVGVVVVSRILGIAWNDAQWLVAALGVGLGFGLQEIVANFVSGLIVLTERPVRVGDVVTVGGVTGTVSGIRARSTRLIDYDNKEVIIPNKAFITDRVVNWTLSDQTTRLLLTVGVAYGSDIEQVQQALLEVARSNPDVVRTPAPSVFFVGFGDSALNFEVRAFVDSMDKRLRVQHELYLGFERALARIGVEIPFPQRDLNIRSAPGLEGMLRGGQPT